MAAALDEALVAPLRMRMADVLARWQTAAARAPGGPGAVADLLLAPILHAVVTARPPEGSRFAAEVVARGLRSPGADEAD